MKICNGDDVMIRFDDHVMNSDELMRLIVHGRVADHDKTKVVVDSWHYDDGSAERDTNCETFTIARSCIREYIKLVPEAQDDKGKPVARIRAPKPRA